MIISATSLPRSTPAPSSSGFIAWVAALTNQHARRGHRDRWQASQRSYQTKGSKKAIHMLSAFAGRQRIVLEQVKVSEKSNGFVAILALLDMMSIEGTMVTIDAMGCLRARHRQENHQEKTDYVIALKGNQGTLA